MTPIDKKLEKKVKEGKIPKPIERVSSICKNAPVACAGGGDPWEEERFGSRSALLQGRRGEDFQDLKIIVVRFPDQLHSRLDSRRHREAVERLFRLAIVIRLEGWPARDRPVADDPEISDAQHASGARPSRVGAQLRQVHAQVLAPRGLGIRRADAIIDGGALLVRLPQTDFLDGLWDPG